MKLLLALLLAVVAGFAHIDRSSAADQQEWRFKVYLGKREIGHHTFRLLDRGNEREVRSEANFKVKILFINAYRYAHQNRETWRGDCLEDMRANTNDNGEAYDVSGAARGEQFVVATADRTARLGACVRSFAYWDRRLLRQARLLNAQTGEYVEVKIEAEGQDWISVSGKTVPAWRYRLRGDEFEITLWYSADDRWLALDSITADGHHIRYRM